MKANSDPTLFQVAEIQVSYHPNFKAIDRPKVSCSKDCFEVLYNNWNHHKLEMQEQCYILLLNQANYVLGIAEVSTGGLSCTVMDPKMIFSIALKANCASLVLSHNHPSGNLKASVEDLRITRKLIEVGKLLELPVLDHIIITRSGYLSFGDEGLM